MTIETQIRTFVNDEILYEPSMNGDPLAAGLLDSLAIEQLIVYLEEEFSVTFQDDDMVAENFIDLATVARLVEEKLQRASP